MGLIFCVNLETYFALDILVFSFLNGVELHSRIIHFVFYSVIFKLRSICLTSEVFFSKINQKSLTSCNE